MSRFALKRDIDFFKTISKELVDDVIETILVIYKLSTSKTHSNLYGESIDKWYENPVKVAGIISRDTTRTNETEFGPDTSQTVEYRFNRDTLKEKEVYPEIGDVIYHNDTYFEISNVRDDQYIGGRTGQHELSTIDLDERFSIVCETFMVRRSQLNIEEEINLTI